jgi:hypothetical protein
MPSIIIRSEREVYVDRCDVCALLYVIFGCLLSFTAALGRTQKKTGHKRALRLMKPIQHPTSPYWRVMPIIHNRGSSSHVVCLLGKVVSSLVSLYSPEGLYPSDDFVFGSGNDELNPRLLVSQGQRVSCCSLGLADKATNTSSLSHRGWILQERLILARIPHWSESVGVNTKR